MRDELKTYFAVFIALGGLLFIFTFLSDKYTDKEFLENLWVELHGMVFDLLIIGILITFLQRLAIRKQLIQTYIDEIYEIKDIETQEGIREKRKNILRLTEFGKTNIDLTNCKLQNIDLKNINLQRAKLSFAELQNAGLWKAQLQDANLEGAQLQGANLLRANLQNANLEQANLQGSILVKAKLKEAKLQSANLKKAQLRGAILEKAQLKEANFEEADLRETEGLELSNVSEVKSFYKARLDQKVEKLINDHCPHLLAKPDS